MWKGSNWYLFSTPFIYWIDRKIIEKFQEFMEYIEKGEYKKVSKKVI